MYEIKHKLIAMASNPIAMLVYLYYFACMLNRTRFDIVYWAGLLGSQVQGIPQLIVIDSVGRQVPEEGLRSDVKTKGK